MKNFITKILRKIKPGHVILILMALFILFNGSPYNLIHNKIEISKLKKRNIETDKEFEVLKETLEKLEKGDAAYIESVARAKYHMTKPGEIEFRISK